MGRIIEYLKLLKEVIAVIPTIWAFIEGLFLHAVPISVNLQKQAFLLSVLLSLFGIFIVVACYYCEKKPQRLNKMHWWAVFWIVCGIFIFGIYFYIISYFEVSLPKPIHSGIILDIGLITGYSLFFFFLSIAFSLLGMEIHLKRILKRNSTPPDQP